MNGQKQKDLEAKGFKIGTVAEFLQLSPEEEQIIELRLALSAGLKERRIKADLTQQQFAAKIRSSQSRVAKMEAGDPSVSIDLLIRSLYSTGIDNEMLAEIVKR